MRTFTIVFFVHVFAKILFADAAISTSFETGENVADGWSLRNGEGKWENEGHTGTRSLSLTGNGEDQAMWVFPSPFLEPGRAYRFSVWYKSEKREGPGNFSVTAGFNFAFRRFEPSAAWSRVELTARTPATTTGSFIRLGQSRFNGKVWFDDLQVEPARVTYLSSDGITLDEHERIENRRYVFEPDFSSPTTNCYRVSQADTCTYHENRAMFNNRQYWIHEYYVGGHQQLSGELFMRIGRDAKQRGPFECVIEASKDGANWQKVGQRDAVGEFTLQMPREFFPAECLFVRISSNMGAFYIAKYRYSAQLDGSPPDLVGKTEVVKSNYVVVNNGPLELVFEEGEGPIVSIRRGGKQVGNLRCVVAEFEKEGLGYKRTGIGTAMADSVKSITFKEKGETKCVAEVVLERTRSEETKRRFEATYRLTLYAGQPWFKVQLASVKNTDVLDYEIVGYYHGLMPVTGEEARPTSREICGAWIGEGGFLGVLAANPEDFTIALHREHGDIVRKQQTKLPAGQTWSVTQPDVIIYAGDGGEKAFARETRRIEKLLRQPESEYASGSISYE